MSEDKKTAQANGYPSSRISWLVFAWVCTECIKTNYLTWNDYSFYGPVDECSKCEKAHNVKVPFV